MRNIIKNKIKILFCLIGIIIIMGSCEYDPIRDADYFDEIIYMPAALYNPFMINTVPEANTYTPTPGFPERFTVDTINNQFNVLLGAYRSGVYLDGSFNVDIAVNTDTIVEHINNNDLLPAGTVLLPNSAYSIPSSIIMEDGEYLSKFDLSVDLDFLRDNYPTQIYAIAVGISSVNRATNPDLETAIIVIDTKIMKPTASFIADNPSGADPKLINFTNTSLYGTTFIWDFGDDSPVKVTTTMVNEDVSHTYATAGTYDVTLTVVGVADYADRSVLTQSVVVL